MTDCPESLVQRHSAWNTVCTANSAMEGGERSADEYRMEPFKNRREAGRRLVRRLEQYAGRKDLLVLALPRGGVPVAYEIATILRAPLDILVVRKLGVPGHE